MELRAFPTVLVNLLQFPAGGSLGLVGFNFGSKTSEDTQTHTKRAQEPGFEDSGRGMHAGDRRDVSFFSVTTDGADVRPKSPTQPGIWHEAPGAQPAFGPEALEADSGTTMTNAWEEERVSKLWNLWCSTRWRQRVGVDGTSDVFEHVQRRRRSGVRAGRWGAAEAETAKRNRPLDLADRHVGQSDAANAPIPKRQSGPASPLKGHGCKILHKRMIPSLRFSRATFPDMQPGTVCN